MSKLHSRPTARDRGPAGRAGAAQVTGMQEVSTDFAGRVGFAL